jgi:hypothetical protein
MINEKDQRMNKSIINYNIFKGINKKQQLLEPMSTIAKLILLNFYEEGTKIYIHSNKINIDPPHNTQFMERFIHGNSRNDVCILGSVLDKYIHFYLNSTHYDLHNELKQLTRYACLGLKKLQTTYYHLNSRINDNCIYTLQYFINYLNECVEKGEHDIISFTQAEHLLDTDKLRKLWNDDDIHQLYINFSKCFTQDPIQSLDGKESIVTKNIQMVNTLLATIDESFINLIILSNSGI